MADIPSARSGPDHRVVTLDDQKIAESLAGLHRAIAAWQFYPPSHPTLGEALAAGYQAWELSAEDGRWVQPGLQLRSGGMWLGETRISEVNPAVVSLVRVFAGHGLIGLRRTGLLSREGFEALVAILATAPDVVTGRGGICAVWQSQPFAGALGLEAPAVTAGAGEGEPGGTQGKLGNGEKWGSGLTVSDEELEGADEFVLGKLHSLQQGSPQDRVLVDLLLRLRRTEELGEFLDLLGEITRFVNAYLDRGQYREVFYVVLYLHRESQNQDASGQDAKRDCLLDTVRMLVKGDVLDWLIQQMKSAGGEAEAEAAESILRALGKAGVVPVINTLCVERGLGARRRLVNVLVSIGEPSVPWAVKMLDDQRWFVVRNMVTVLGGVGSPEAQKALVRLSRDPDPRIRKEVARALGRGPVEEAEETLLALLEDRDQGVRLMAVKASAGHASRRVLDGVWRAYRKTPIRSAHWELKVVALHTLGRMGLGEAERLLLRVLCRRGWFFRDRWLRVRCAAARALGQIGGAVSGRVLARFRERGKPELRVAAARALAAMERRGEEGR